MTRPSNFFSKSLESFRIYLGREEALKAAWQRGLRDFSQKAQFDFDTSYGPANVPPAFRGAVLTFSIASFCCNLGGIKSLPLVRRPDNAYVAQG